MLSAQDAKKILTDVLDSVKSPENVSKFNEATSICGNDMLKRMQIVYPLLMKIQMDTIRKHGYSSDSESLLKFCQEVAVLEKENDEILRLNDAVRDVFIPKIPNYP